MSSKKQILSYFFILFSLLFLSTFNFEIKTEVKEEFIEVEDIKVSKVWTKIYINGNQDWQDLVSDDNFTGSGIYSDPYIIKDFEIDGSGSGVCIDIRNSDVYFRIENCTLSNAYLGIQFINVTNGKIVNNTITGITGRYGSSKSTGGIGAGVYLSNSYNNTLHNNTISSITGGHGGSGSNSNGASGGLGAGVYLSNSYNNTLHKNTINSITGGEGGYGDYADGGVGGVGAGVYFSNSYNNTLHNNTLSSIIGGQGGDGDDADGGVGGVGAGVYLLNSYNNTLQSNTLSSITGGQGGLGTPVGSVGVEGGVYFSSSSDNTILKNLIYNVIGTVGYGIFLDLNSNNNLISGNTVKNNFYGIYLDQSSSHIISENIIYGNGNGIYLLDSVDNLIYFNAIFNNSGYNGYDNTLLNDWDNGLVGNYWSNYTGIDANHDGIGDTPYNVSGPGVNIDNKPLMNYNPFFFNSPDDLTYEIGTEDHSIKWTVINALSDPYSFNILRAGISIKTGLLFTYLNEITVNIDNLDEGNYEFTIEADNGLGGIFTDNVQVTVFNTNPVFTSTLSDFSYEVGEIGNKISWMFSDVSTNNPTYTINRNNLPLITNELCVSDDLIEINVDGLDIESYCFTIEINDGYDGSIMDNVWVTVFNTLPIFSIKANDTSYEVGEIGNNISWMFSDVSTNNPTYTIYRNNLPLIMDEPTTSGVEIEISVDGLEEGSHVFTIEINDGYGESISDVAWINVIDSSSLVPSNLTKFLQVEIIDQFFSLDGFNITTSVNNESGQGIDFAIIQLYWNGSDFSNSIQNLGGGLYFVSLDPITVAPGEESILLSLTISAKGYQDKLFRTFLAVDPETLEKVSAESVGEFPLFTVIIASTSIVGGIGVVGITFVILRKRKLQK